MIGWLKGPEFEKYIPLLLCAVIGVFCTIVLGFMIDATVNNQANINNVVAIQTVINNNVTTSSTSTSSINGIVNNDNNNNIGLCLSLTQWNNIVADLHEIETTMEDNGMINIACLVILGAQILILIVACILLRKARLRSASGVYMVKEKSPLLSSASISGGIPPLTRMPSSPSLPTRDGTSPPNTARSKTSMMHEGPLYEPWNQTTLDKLSSEADLSPMNKVTRAVYRYGPIAGRIMARRFGHLLSEPEQMEVNRILCL